MSAPMIVGAIWVILATFTAFLPMRRQYVPGITLLILAPILLIWIGYTQGAWYALAGLLAFMSMFRNPLRYLYARARGERPEIPK